MYCLLLSQRRCYDYIFFFFLLGSFFKMYLFIIYGCTGSSLLLVGFLRSQRVGLLSWAWVQLMWSTDSASPRHVGSSRTRDRTCVPCIARWIFNHWTTREVPGLFFAFLLFILSSSLWNASCYDVTQASRHLCSPGSPGGPSWGPQTTAPTQMSPGLSSLPLATPFAPLLPSGPRPSLVLSHFLIFMEQDQS